MSTIENTIDLSEVNQTLKNKSPKQIVDWALSIAKRPVVTTNFRPLEAAILHAVVSSKNDINVIWCDTGYNTPSTYRHADRVIKLLKLNIDLFAPKETTAYRDFTLGIPEPDTADHIEFTRQVKLEPFNRAMEKHQPDVWFTNLRSGQTEHRSNLDIVSLSPNGMLKVCPFYYWTDPQIETYITQNKLETENNYYDPTKALKNRECGLHK